LIGGCLVVATCLPLDERVISERSGGGTGGAGGSAGKGAGGKGGSSAAGGMEAGTNGEGGDEGGSGGASAGTGGGKGGAGGGKGGAGGSGGAAGNGGADGGTGNASGGVSGGAAGSVAGMSGSGGMGVPCGTVEPGLDVEVDYLTGVTGATDIAFHGDGRAVVTQKNGTIVVRRTDAMTHTVSGRFPSIDTGGEKGLLGVVWVPGTDDFYFYVSDGPTSIDKHRVVKGTLDASHDIAIDSTPIVAATVGNGPGIEGATNLVGGGLVIYGDHLFVSVGDSGSNATPPINKYGSCLNKPNGKILRVNLDGTIPNDNPFVGGAVTSCATPTGAFSMAAPDLRIFAWGLRNPWRFWVDPLTTFLWIGDVGEQTREEISVGPGGTHFGWPFFEGTTAYNNLDPMTCSTMSPSKPCTPPVHDYPTTGGASITGGLIPDGCGWDNVWEGDEYYVFGDWMQDTFKAIRVASDHSGIATPQDVIDVLPATAFDGPVSFRMGPDASLYVVLNVAGAVYRLTPKSRCGPKCVAD
jgi:glucose/arabinose dehydrogenase